MSSYLQAYGIITFFFQDSDRLSTIHSQLTHHNVSKWKIIVTMSKFPEHYNDLVLCNTFFQPKCPCFSWKVVLCVSSLSDSVLKLSEQNEFLAK